MAKKRGSPARTANEKDKSGTRCRTPDCTGRRVIKWRGGQGPDGKPLETYTCSSCGRGWPAS